MESNESVPFYEDDGLCSRLEGRSFSGLVSTLNTTHFFLDTFETHRVLDHLVVVS